MVALCNSIFKEIHETSDPEAVRGIVEKSFVDFQEANLPTNKSTFASHMVLTLYGAKMRVHDPRQNQIIDVAIKLYKEHQAKSRKVGSDNTYSSLK